MQHGSGTRVEAGEILGLSVSSIAKFDYHQPGGCPRKWWFRYIAKLPEQKKPAAQKGSDIHGQLEHFLKTGEDVLTPIARAASLFFPSQECEVSVEHRFDGELVADGIPLLGYIDLVNWSCRELVDWKTTGDIRRALTPKQLMRTIQMPGYAKWYLGQRDSEWVKLTHVYILTRGAPYAERRSLEVVREQVDRRWCEIEEIVRDMRGVAKAEKAEDVKPERGACSVYGGCPYRAQCPGGDAIAGIFGGKPMGLMDRLKQMELPKTEPAVEAAAVVPPDAPEPTKPKKVKAKKETETGIELFVDVVGAFGPTEQLEPYVAGVLTQLCEAEGVVDIRCAPDNSAYSFGKWKGALAAAIRANPPSPGRYVYRDVAESEIRQVVCEALKPLCNIFIRGV